jgi:hypothetical protein
MRAHTWIARKANLLIVKKDDYNSSITTVPVFIEKRYLCGAQIIPTNPNNTTA